MTNVHTTDFWPWAGKDGRDCALMGTIFGDGYAYIFDISNLSSIVKTDSIKLDARAVNDVTVSPDGPLYPRASLCWLRRWDDPRGCASYGEHFEQPGVANHWLVWTAVPAMTPYQSLDELWPRQKPFGPYPWVDREAFLGDDRPVDYFDRRR